MMNLLKRLQPVQKETVHTTIEHQWEEAAPIIFAQARYILYLRGYSSRSRLVSERVEKGWRLTLELCGLSSTCFLAEGVLGDHKACILLGKQMADGLSLDELATLEVG